MPPPGLAEVRKVETDIGQGAVVAAGVFAVVPGGPCAWSEPPSSRPIRFVGPAPSPSEFLAGDPSLHARLLRSGTPSSGCRYALWNRCLEGAGHVTGPDTTLPLTMGANVTVVDTGVMVPTASTNMTVVDTGVMVPMATGTVMPVSRRSGGRSVGKHGHHHGRSHYHRHSPRDYRPCGVCHFLCSPFLSRMNKGPRTLSGTRPGRPSSGLGTTEWDYPLSNYHHHEPLQRMSSPAAAPPKPPLTSDWSRSRS